MVGLVVKSDFWEEALFEKSRPPFRDPCPFPSMSPARLLQHDLSCGL